MQLGLVKLQVALQRKDAAAARELEYMRVHREDAMGTWQLALLVRNDLDAAGDLVVERLRHPAWRTQALTDMHHYAEVRMTPGEAERQARWVQVLSQPRVQAAWRKVGRIERFNLGPPQT